MGSQAKGPWVEKLEKILVREGNDKCADCDSPNPRWVSSNLGCIICIRCSGIHRSLGTHISRVRSIELDEWSDAQIQLLERKGNKRVNLVYEANIPPTTKKITAQSSFEEATSYIKAKYNGDFKSATANGWKGATVAQESLEDDKKTSASITRTHGDSHLSESDLRRRTMFLKNARGQQVPSQESLLPAGADVAESDDDSDDSAAKNQGSGIQRRSPLSSSGEHGGDAVSEVWNTLEMTGVGSDLRRAQMEERKRMMNEAKLKKEAKKKEEKERKKKEDEEQKKKKRDDKKQKRKSWWRGRAMDGEAIALKHEMDSMMGQEDVYAVNEDELRDKRENDHRRVRERMRLYEEVKRQKRGQTQETTCPHCHSHVPLLSSADVRSTAVDSRQLAVEASAE